MCFADHVAAGMSLRAAYLAAGYSPKGTPRTIMNMPSRLVRMPGIKARIAQQREIYAKEHGVSVASLLAELEHARNQALDDGAWAAVVKAIELKAKLLGLLVERVEDVTQRVPLPTPSKEIELSAEEWERRWLPGANKTNGSHRPN
jgi:hypothetical protein